MLAFAKKMYKLYWRRPVSAIKFSRPFWLFLNRKSRALYQKNNPSLDAVQQRIATELRDEGVAVTSMEELFAAEPQMFADILKHLETLIPNATQDPKKVHFKNLWDTRSFLLDWKSPFVRLALSPRLVQIANDYMGMWSRLHLANAYISDPRPEATGKVQTQNWHRDAHDKQLVVIFLYLTDVNTPEDGAFWYLRQTHVFGKFNKVFAQPAPNSTKKFPPESEIDESIPSEYKKLCLGKKGTLIFTDGTGIHRGGHSTANRRIIFLADYASDHRFSDTRRISYPADLSDLKNALTAEGLYTATLETGVAPQTKMSSGEGDTY